MNQSTKGTTMMDRRRFLMNSSGLALSSPLAAADWVGSVSSRPDTDPSWAKRTEAKLLDWRYLEGRVRSVGVFALIDEFHDGIAALSLDRPSRRLLVLIREAIRRETMFLAEHPERLFQCLWNSGWWYDGPLTRLFLSPTDGQPSADAPWNHAEPKLSTWLEQWRTAREAARPGEIWVRALTPPELPLGAGHLATLIGHRQQISCLAISRNGRWLASGSYDRTVLVWETRHGEPRLWPERATGMISCVAFSPDGQRLAASSVGGEVFVWDVESNQHIAQWSAHPGMVRCLAWSPDGQSLWSGGDSKIICWQSDSGRNLRHMGLTHIRGRLCDLSISADARMAATAGADGVWLIDLSSSVSRLLISSEEGRIETVILSPDGCLLLTNGLDDCVRVWETQTGTQLWATRQADDATFHPNIDDWSAAFTPDSKTVIVGGVDGTIRLLDSWSGVRRPTGLQMGAPPSDLTVSADGKTLAAVEGYGVIRLLDLQHCEPTPAVRPEFTSLHAWATSPDGRWLIIGSSSGSLMLWDLAQGVPIESWIPAENWTWTKASFSNHPVWDTDSIERFIARLAITNDGHLIAISDRQQEIKLLDRREGGRLRMLRGYTDHIQCLEFSADGRCLASHSADGTVRVWRNDAVISILCLPFSEDSDTDVDYCFRGYFFLVNASPGQRSAFDTDTAEFCTDPDTIRELFADQASSANNDRADMALLARSLSEHFEFAKSVHSPQALSLHFQSLPTLAATWLGEFTRPPLLLHQEGTRH